MDEFFKIYIDRLRHGESYPFEGDLASDFLDVQDKELTFVTPVHIEGEAYLAGDELVVQSTVQTKAALPCSICNQPVPIEIEIKAFYHAEPVSEIKAGIYNFQDVIREAVLLEIPMRAECNQGNCREREFVKQYLKKTEPGTHHTEETYQPFADLE